ncbi:aminopeptidase P N-terminal domain-containing protein [soil metagenome]
MKFGRTGGLLLFPLLFSSCAPAHSPGIGPGQAAPRWEVPQLPAGSPIEPQEYAARRAALAAGLEDGVLLVMGAQENEQDYLPFAQVANFRYLTGITEPGAALVMTKRGGAVSEDLFVLPRNPEREVWEGARLGPEQARALTGVRSHAVTALPAVLDSLLRTGERLYTPVALASGTALLATLSPEQQVVERLRARHSNLTALSVGPQIQALRANKSPAELDLIRRAIHISVLAHRAAMRTVEPGMNEFEILALLEYYFRRYGAERPAYSSIVGSGPNSTTLHYREADRFMQANEVLLIDAAASYRGYAADITRTMPVNGRFTPGQRAIYEIVLRAQKAAEELIRPGAGWGELNAAADREIAAGLANLGLIDSPTATYACESPRFSNACPQYRLYYMHGLGHGIGLDVHDPDVSYTDRGFQPGSAFTIEPGIYVRADALDFLLDVPANRDMIERLRPVVERYRNIGVRIEDDYIVLPSGVERLSAGVPREIEEIEALMRQPRLDPERQPELVEWYRVTTPGR